MNFRKFSFYSFSDQKLRFYIFLIKKKCSVWLIIINICELHYFYLNYLFLYKSIINQQRNIKKKSEHLSYVLIPGIKNQMST